jgi:hypothetical protein
MNKDGVITNADAKQPVSYMQNYFGGFVSTISYKNLDLSIFIQFVKQNNAAFTIGFIPGAATFNQPASLLANRWRKPGDQATAQFFTRNNANAVQAYERYRFSDGVMTDASFIRLKNVDLSYRIPEKWLKGIRTRIYVQGQNLLTITNYFGMDPETGYSNLPPLTKLVAGLQLTL